MSDPLLDRRLVGDRERVLFDALSRAATGFGRAHVVGAAANLIINALREEHERREAAGKAFDELFGRVKELLMEHYDSRGRRRGVFAYDQTVTVEHFDARSLKG
jgi:hypothetical protein